MTAVVQLPPRLAIHANFVAKSELLTAALRMAESIVDCGAWVPVQKHTGAVYMDTTKSGAASFYAE